MEAVAFATGEPANHLRLKSWSDLHQAPPKVAVEWASLDGCKLRIEAWLDLKQGRCVQKVFA